MKSDIVHRLGYLVFIQRSGVRLPVSEDFFIFCSMSFSDIILPCPRPSFDTESTDGTFEDFEENGDNPQISESNGQQTGQPHYDTVLKDTPTLLARIRSHY